MTLDEAIKYNGRLKIVTTKGNCKIGTIEEVEYPEDNEELKEPLVLFNAVDDGYTFSESEIVSIEKV